MTTTIEILRQYGAIRRRPGFLPNMQKIIGLSVVIGICILSLLAGGQPAYAQPLQYHGGPVLETFRIYPLYYGDWSETEIKAQQEYLVNLAGYLSGKNAPASSQPMMKQYGVNQATVAPAATASPSATATTLARADVLNIIKKNQAAGTLPAFGPSTLIMVFPAHGFTLASCDGCGYHTSESSSAFWSVVPADAGPTLALVTSHEVFEASADPAVASFQGWDEAVDQCDSATSITLSFGQIPPATDNTNAGACSTTGYTSLNEIQVYGTTYANFKAQYDSLWPDGWRLYILQAYVMPGGQVLYNAVWRPTGNTPEIQVYGWTYADYRAQYDTLWKHGWRIYILDAYVLENGSVLYNAVWRQGSLAEHQDYGVSYSQYRSDYNGYWPDNWRLYILQSYVVPDSSNPAGDVEFNAVWRPGNSAEIQDYGVSYDQYRSYYNTLWMENWRLYSLQSYVMFNGTVKYNAVWRPGDHGEIQDYGVTYSQFRSDYNTYWMEGWRLYILQTYVTPGGAVYYNAVWRQGTVDRPL
jgi:hypothetical protein